MCQVVFEREDDDMTELASTIASVTESDWEANIDANVSLAFNVTQSFENHSIPSSDVDFFNAMNLREDISKLSVSIGSYNVSYEPCSDFDIYKTSFSKWEQVESTFKSVLNPEEIEHVKSKVLSTQASRFRRVSKELLSKLWIVPENLAEKEIEWNTQLCRKSKNNNLSRNYTKNDRMLRFKRLQSVLFTDTMFATKHKSTKVNKCCQVFVSDEGYIVHPMKYQDEFETALHWFCTEFGVLVNMIVDGFSTQKKPSVKRFCDQVGTALNIL